MTEDAATERTELPYIVAIGASAGGLEALETFFATMPADSGMAFVVVQHLTPDFKSLMDELLARHTQMPILKVEQDMPVRPDTVYLIPSRKMMTLRDGRFDLTERDPSVGINLPIDHFFVSLAGEAKERAIGIVLSGTGSDGARGIRAVHEMGGLVLCQAPDTARFDGMPKSAEATGVVDLVISPSAMPSVLIDYVNHDRTIAGQTLAERQQGDGDGPFSPILDLLRERFGVDFHNYKPGTISRRIDRRMAMHGVASIDAYYELMTTLPTEPLNLYRDLLIGVTEFFRDQAAWTLLEKQIIPEICARVSSSREIRCWVPGTATGEEAYSLAILLHEYLTRNKLPVNVRVFATDVHADSLEVAGAGLYPASAMSSVHPERAARYFKRVDDERFQVTPEIRALVVFARQNLICDPPFTKLDLISCRNAIIYFETEIQQKVLSTFHFALNLRGYLFLGPSESLADLQDEFETIDRHWKIYSKRRNVRIGTAARETGPREIQPVRTVTNWAHYPPPRQVAGRDISLLRTYDTLLERYVPPSILIESSGRLAHSFNAASDYLRAPQGLASLDILDVIHPDLRMALSTGMQRALKEPSAVRYGGIRVKLSDEDERIVRVTIELLGDSNSGDYFLATFEEAHRIVSEKDADGSTTTNEVLAPADEVAPFDVSAANSEHVARLEQELRYTKEYLQATVEELETSNEELQATNEELMAANEELQSTNEELHSVNEELYTVNREYESKITELTVLTDDMDNLLASTEIGTVFLDEALCIRRFTPAVARQFSLLSQDVGRPIGHLNRKINFPDFMHALGSVLESGEQAEHEVRDADGNWFLMRIHPYRVESGAIDGVVVTFVDISGIKTTSEQLAQRNEDLQGFAYAVSHDMSEPLRMVSGFAKLLHDNAPRQLDDKTSNYLDQIQDGAQRLRAMIQGVLEYSRVVTRAEPHETVDFYDVLGEARERLQRSIVDSSARIETRVLPHRLHGDRRQVVKVVTEVLENAIKFCDREEPEIRIDSALEDGMWRISFTDNGPGVPPEQSTKIFEIFRRSGADRSIDGHGVGLAVARRIAEMHGGTLECEARPGRGARFILALPDPDQGSERALTQ